MAALASVFVSSRPQAFVVFFSENPRLSGSFGGFFVSFLKRETRARLVPSVQPSAAVSEEPTSFSLCPPFWIWILRIFVQYRVLDDDWCLGARTLSRELERTSQVANSCLAVNAACHLSLSPRRFSCEWRFVAIQPHSRESVGLVSLRSLWNRTMGVVRGGSRARVVASLFSKIRRLPQPSAQPSSSAPTAAGVAPAASFSCILIERVSRSESVLKSSRGPGATRQIHPSSSQRDRCNSVRNSDGYGQVALCSRGLSCNGQNVRLLLLSSFWWVFSLVPAHRSSSSKCAFFFLFFSKCRWCLKKSVGFGLFCDVRICAVRSTRSFFDLDFRILPTHS